jgi:hypothetical protein
MKLFISCCLALVLILAGNPSQVQALDELVLYDNFKGKSIDPNKWEPTGSAERDSFDLVREVRGNYLRMLNRIYAGKSTSVRVKFPVPEDVTAIMIKGKVKDLELIECAGNDRIRALRASGTFFNTNPSGNSGPFNATDDVLAAIYVERRGDSLDPPGVLRVIALVVECGDANCDGGNLLYFQPLGEYRVGAQIRLLIQWDDVLDQFIFQRDNEELIYSYSGIVSNQGPPGWPQKRLGISPRVGNCTADPQPVAFVETRIYEVFVNESAVP